MLSRALRPPAISRRVYADGILLLVALIWGSAFVVQRIAVQQLGVFLFNGLRFLLGALALLPFARVGRNLSRQLFVGAAVAGAILFAASALQQAGLRYTTAGNAGFITGLYVVLVPIILVIFLRERLHWSAWAAAAAAVTGATLLSSGGAASLASGDLLVLIGSVGWALHVIVVGRMARRVDILAFSVGQYLVAGVLNGLSGLVLEADKLSGLASAWWTVVYIGLLSTAVGYTLQTVGQKHAPPHDAAILLSMETVFAALFGYWVLGEELSALQMTGCGLILSAIVLVQLKRKAET